jgi:hypothetical protein
LKWRELSFDPTNVKNDFVSKVVRPVRAMASKTIDANAVVLGSLLPIASATAWRARMTPCCSTAQR